MRWLFVVSVALVQLSAAHATLFHQPVNDEYSLVAVQSDLRRTKQKGPFALGVAYRGRSIGLARDWSLGDAWKGSLGLMVSDDSADIDSQRSIVNVLGRPIDINDLISIQARLKFSPVTPYISVSYQYRYDQDTKLDVYTGLKFFQLTDGSVRLGNLLGKQLQASEQVSTLLQQVLARAHQVAVLLHLLGWNVNESQQTARIKLGQLRRIETIRFDHSATDSGDAGGGHHITMIALAHQIALEGIADVGGFISHVDGVIRKVLAELSQLADQPLQGRATLKM